MREILFKAKRIDNGEWVEGLLTVMWGQYHIINPNDENTAYPIDSETVCQYTGLKDKRGNKIWENDVIRDSVIFGAVEWESEWAKFILNDVLDGIQNYEEWFSETEVVGNKFDNPELLGD